MPELNLPAPGVTAGPGWASQLNAAITEINDEIETGRLSEPELSATIGEEVAASAGTLTVPIHAKRIITATGSSSMFSGQGGGTIFPQLVAERAGFDGFFRGGKGGIRGQHIMAWMGIRPAMLTVSGGEIPASGSVTVTTSYDAWHANTGYAGTLAGVPGTLEAFATNQWRFTRTTTGSAVAVTGPVAMIPSDYPQHQGDVALINVPKNDLMMMAGSDETVVAYALKVTREIYDWYGRGVARPMRLVLGHFVDAAGTNDAYKRRVLIYNAGLAREYGMEYIDTQGLVQSTRMWALSGVTPTGADTTAQENGTLPPSLQYDTMHMKYAGWSAWAWYVVERMRHLGWASTPAVNDIPVGGVGPLGIPIIELDPANVDAYDGGDITRWRSTGIMPVILDSKDDASGTFDWPTLLVKGGPDGGPVANFDAAAQQKIGVATYPYSLTQPMTYVFVVRVDAESGANARIISGVSPTFHGIRLSSDVLGFAATAVISSTVAPSGAWQIIVASFSGGTSGIRVGTTNVEGIPGTAVASNIVIGGQWGVAFSADAAFDGAVRVLRIIPGASSAHQRLVLARNVADEFMLTL